MNEETKQQITQEGAELSEQSLDQVAGGAETFRFTKLPMDEKKMTPIEVVDPPLAKLKF